MIKNLIFDFGAVLVDWNPRYVYDAWFKEDKEREEYFLTNICNMEWNSEMDSGKPFQTAVEERISLFPEWEPEIRLYKEKWMGMIGGAIPGMYELVKKYKEKGYGIYGLTNWSAETFYKVEPKFPVFQLLDGKIVSGDVKVLKPEARIFKLLMDKYNLKPEECAFIDDNAANVAGAKAVGIQGILFTGASALESELKSLNL